MDGFSRLLIEGAFAFDNIWWHEETNPPVGATALLGVFGIVLLIDNMIVQKPRFFAARVGNQRFLLRHFQLEGLSQELSQLVLDFFCFLSWTSKTEERIVCLHSAHSEVVDRCHRWGRRSRAFGTVFAVLWLLLFFLAVSSIHIWL